MALLDHHALAVDKAPLNPTNYCKTGSNNPTVAKVILYPTVILHWAKVLWMASFWGHRSLQEHCHLVQALGSFLLHHQLAHIASLIHKGPQVHTKTEYPHHHKKTRIKKTSNPTYTTTFTSNPTKTNNPSVPQLPRHSPRVLSPLPLSLGNAKC